MGLAEVLSRARLLTAARRSYVPHDLHAKQRAFLAMGQLEALYGGAAGGGKSDALLAAALQYVHVPGYAALILRRTFADLALPDAIMARAKKWLDGTDAEWNEQRKAFTFPSGAILQFGYCDTAKDLARYKSAAFQFIGIDELTEWPEGWYRFLFSRLRRPRKLDVPLRMRGATNPDGLGQEWVRLRFAIPLGEIIEGPIASNDNARVFLPARAEDNPSLDLEAYEESLKQLGPQKYQQLRWGRWVRDAEGLVYAYDSQRNLLGAPLERDKTWKYILALDFGFVDSTAFVVLGWRPHDPTVYVIASFKRPKLTPSAVGAVVKGLEKDYKFSQIVGDVGGLGKAYAEEIKARFRVPIEPAEKNNKRGYIELLNGDLQLGRLRLFPGNEAMVQEWLVLPWDPERRMPAEGFEDHLADACLYGWRAAWAYTAKPEELPPPSPDANPGKEEYLRRRKQERGTKQQPSWRRGFRRAS